MSFINKQCSIVRRSNKDMFYFDLHNGIYYNKIDSLNNTLSKFCVTKDASLNFTKSSIFLDNNDNIYGVYNDKGLKLINIPRNNDEFYIVDLLDYDYSKFDIYFPYIHLNGSNIDIIYYVYNHNTNNCCALFHNHKSNNLWIENKIDFIDHIVLNNFVVIMNNNIPSIFYLKLVNNFEELFYSRFDISTLTWSSPLQITNSKTSKLYLSVLKDSMNFYHISFCENISDGYAIRYINGYLQHNNFDIIENKYITGPSLCMHPNFIKHKNSIYIMWINYGRLNTSISIDNGATWSDHKIDENSVEYDFILGNFYSNYKNDEPYDVTSIFTTVDDVGILGF